MYLCHQAIYSERHRDRIRAAARSRERRTIPLRVVVFGEIPSDAARRLRLDRAELPTGTSCDPGASASRTRVIVRGKASYEDRYVIYDFVPRARPRSSDERRPVDEGVSPRRPAPRHNRMTRIIGRSPPADVIRSWRAPAACDPGPAA